MPNYRSSSSFLSPSSSSSTHIPASPPPPLHPHSSHSSLSFPSPPSSSLPSFHKMAPLSSSSPSSSPSTLATSRSRRLTSSTRTRTSRRSTLPWSLLCTLVLLQTFISLLSPSNPSLTVQAGLDPGFCGDCQTFANAISVCGGSFGPQDIEISGTYVLQQAYSKCICTEVMQRVLWICAKCELLAGHDSHSPPPQAYQTQCISWGMTQAEWKAPYTGVVAPGTQTDLGNGTPNPTGPPPVQTSGLPVKPSERPKPTNTGGNGNGGNDGKPSDPAQPSGSSDNSTSGPGGKKDGSGGPDMTAIGISVGIIGVAAVAGIVAVVMMKRRRRRRAPLDLDSSPALANFVGSLEDKWEQKPGGGHHHHRPSSPPMVPAPVASAVGNGAAAHRGYDGRTYLESTTGGGSVVGGYDHYDKYDKYDHTAAYGAAGGSQLGYDQQAYDRQAYDQQGYDQHGYDQYGYGAQGYTEYDQGYHPGSSAAAPAVGSTGQSQVGGGYEYDYYDQAAAATAAPTPAPPKNGGGYL